MESRVITDLVCVRRMRWSCIRCGTRVGLRSAGGAAVVELFALDGKAYEFCRGAVTISDWFEYRAEQRIAQSLNDELDAHELMESL